MPQYNTSAVVLRRIHFGETDNILTLFSKEHGKISAIAKGARKAISRLSGATDPLTCSRFALATGHGLQVIVQAEMIDSFPGLHDNVARLAQGQYFVELMSAFTEDDAPHPELYTLLVRALRLMEKAPDPESIARWYEIRLLDELGYAPDLTQCASCGEEVPGVFEAGAIFGLSASQGSALCPPHCAPQDHSDHSPLSHGALSFLREIAGAPEKASAVAAVHPPDRKAEDQSRAALRRHIRFRIDRDLKSLAFLDGLRYGG
jgi:DNA repair protein RecO (recombination protein O)